MKVLNHIIYENSLNKLNNFLKQKKKIIKLILLHKKNHKCKKDKYLKIANLFSFLNALCGMISINYINNNNKNIATIFIFLSLLCDYIDGPIARLSKVKYNLNGTMWDAIADLISFVANPSFLVYKLLLSKNNKKLSIIVSVILFLSGLYRLLIFSLNELDDKINNKEKKEKIFSGFPTPLVTILIYAMAGNIKSSYVSFLTVVLSWLLNSSIPIAKPDIKFISIISLIICVLLKFNLIKYKSNIV